MTRPRLAVWSLYAAALSGAGLPIYIYAPVHYAETWGVGLAGLGAVLFALRLVDVLQDPALGWLAERLAGRARRRAAGLAALVMGIAVMGLLAVPPPVAPLAWFALCLAAMFTAYSFLSICFYAEGVARGGAGGQLALAAWRESGALAGVCLAAVAPALLAGATAAPHAAYALAYAGVLALAALLMAREWQGGAAAAAPVGLRAILSDRPARRLMVLALVNGAPLAVCSTLFLFFVGHRLAAPGWEGPLLVLFFLAAALAAPGWTALARARGERPVLLAAMALAILAFSGTLLLGPGDVLAFAAISALSGAAIGADLTLLPALFARRMAELAPRGGAGFGLWGFVNKAALALAAALLLPALQWGGFDATAAVQPAGALTLLTLLYAGLPLALKCAAVALVLRWRSAG